MTDIAFTSDSGKKAPRRLHSEEIIWLTTVRGDGMPQPSPVWFLLQDDGTVLIFSRPDAPKVRAIGTNSRVSLNFNSDPEGGDIVILNGHAMLGETSLAATTVSAYVEKYKESIERLGIARISGRQMIAHRSSPPADRGRESSRGSSRRRFSSSSCFRRTSWSGKRSSPGRNRSHSITRSRSSTSREPSTRTSSSACSAGCWIAAISSSSSTTSTRTTCMASTPARSSCLFSHPPGIATRGGSSSSR